jgi:hypothetical protein
MGTYVSFSSGIMCESSGALTCETTACESIHEIVIATVNEDHACPMSNIFCSCLVD